MIYYACLKEAYNFLIYATPPKTTICGSTFYYNTISIVVTASHFYSKQKTLRHLHTGGFCMLWVPLLNSSFNGAQSDRTLVTRHLFFDRLW